MRALSIRQPWAWLILNAGKDIENRNWPTRYRGRVLVHAGKGCTRAEYEDACDTVDHINRLQNSHIKLPPLTKLQRGGIVGSVEIVDCLTASESPWFFGEHGFVLRKPQLLPFTPWRGELGFFDVPTHALAVPAMEGAAHG